MEWDKLVAIIKEMENLPYGATHKTVYKTKKEVMMEELSKYSIEELLIYCASKTGQERLVTSNIPLRNCLGEVYRYTRAALVEMRKYELDKIIDGESEN